MPSTVIRRYAYDHSTGELWVEFMTGRRYVYSDVPRRSRRNASARLSLKASISTAASATAIRAAKSSTRTRNAILKRDVRQSCA